jgi:hypothetical protein
MLSAFAHLRRLDLISALLTTRWHTACTSLTPVSLCVSPVHHQAHPSGQLRWWWASWIVFDLCVRFVLVYIVTDLRDFIFRLSFVCEGGVKAGVEGGVAALAFVAARVEESR